MLYNNRCSYCGDTCNYPFTAHTECAMIMHNLQKIRDEKEMEEAIAR